MLTDRCFYILDKFSISVTLVIKFIHAEIVSPLYLCHTTVVKGTICQLYLDETSINFKGNFAKVKSEGLGSMFYTAITSLRLCRRNRRIQTHCVLTVQCFPLILPISVFWMGSWQWQKIWPTQTFRS